MFFTVLIAFISLIILVSLHELGHFLTAKKFGVRVEEFGIGYPPRLLGKKFGDTLYSLNLLPFGAFVRISEEPSDNPSSFFAKPLWQRALIVFNGALSFWLVAAVLFSIVFAAGVSMAVTDEEQNLQGPKVQISAIAFQSPADSAGLKPGDTIVKIQNPKSKIQIEVDKVKNLQDFISQNKGQEVILTIKRGNNVFDVAVVPRVAPPSGQGALGVGLVRTAVKHYPWYQAPVLGLKSAFGMTAVVISSYYQALLNVFRGVPSGVQLTGPIGIVGLLTQGIEMGFIYFLQMIGVLSINVAVLNLLPIPVFDGGKLLFLGIEAVRRKPVPQKLEERITLVFFSLLILLMVFVSIKDISNFRGLF
jgi:regulator of sigma E protease